MALEVNGQSQLNEAISEEGKIVFVDFWAEWCGPCKTLGPTLEQLEEDFSDKVKVVKVNVEEDANQELAGSFGVTSIPFVVLYKDGQQVDNFVGALPYENLKEFVEKHS